MLYNYDIETYLEYFLAIFKNVETGEFHEFRINKWQDDTYKLLKFLESDIEYLIGYNCNLFDGNVITWIKENYEKWYNLSGLEKARLISVFADNLIDDLNHDLQPKYQFSQLIIPHIDLYKLHHFNGDAKRTSLKWVEFSLDFPTIEEIPIYHRKEDLTEEEIEVVTKYCYNDVNATEALYLVTIGKTELPLYKDKNKIQLRMDLVTEFNLSKECLSWNDVQIGDELNKKNYLELCNKTYPNSKFLWELKSKRVSKTGFKFKECFPEYISYKTEFFKQLVNKIGETKVNLNEKQEFKFDLNGTKYTWAKGGGHSDDPKRYIKPKEDEILIDCDCSSMYPNAIRKRKIFPSHLGVKWWEAYTSFIPRRIEMKGKYKETKEKKYDNLQETFKLSLNGNFGRLIDKYNWQYDGFAGMSVTLGCQSEIFMLVEMLEEKNFHVVTLNTDGLTCLFNKSRLEEYHSICKEWETTVKNEELGKLEFIEYEFIAQLSVNDYIALKKGTEDIEDRIKLKGDFLVDFELHKNKSRRIIPIALKNYFIYGKNPEETIRNHENIYDFCIGLKASKDYFYQTLDKKTNKTTKYNRLIRHFISTDGGKLLKMKEEHSDKTGSKISQCEAGDWLSTVFNEYYEKPMKDYNINYEYYIDKTWDIIKSVEGKKSKKSAVVAKNQISMF